MKNVNLRLSRSKSLKERSYEALKDLIFTGKMVPGNLYNETSLAAKLGVSRTPVREALLELSREGMTSFIPGRGVMVQQITEEQIREVYEIRKLVEGHIIEEITASITTENLARINAIIVKQKKMAEKNDLPAFIRADREMHFYMSLKHGNHQIDLIMLNIRDQVHRMGIKNVENSDRMWRVIEEHTAILSALESKDKKAAYNSMIVHLCNSEEALITTIRNA
ncbi:MAG: GntR family transcriptional regulator [Deltaproteobacteria bacterium]|nr:GntR family transcriptional regulator [Deltaproteobacteria bacterium]